MDVLRRALKEKNQEPLLRVAILGGIVLMAFFSRLYSVIVFESVIHEFDPYFNFRSTQYLVENGFYEFHNWFDKGAWYPLGRIVGGTVYPGLMVTAASIYNVLHFLNITIDIRNVCVFTAPLFSSLTALVAYWMGREVRNEGTGLLAAAIIAIVPGYISRSVAGSYDNEGVAIFALLLTYTLWIKAVKTGMLFWSMMTALVYFYMVAAWGGYVFIINLIPLYTVVMMFSGLYSAKLYIAYSSFYLVATLLSMQVTFVGFQPVQSSEHMAAAGTFFLLQAHALVNWVRGVLDNDRLFNRLFALLVGGTVAVGSVAVVAGIATGYISPFTGRFYVMLDPTYASKHIPIIASVSEHQPTTWSSFFFDLHILTFLVPAGLYHCFQAMDEGSVFVILYTITAVYFSGVMVRLMLILAPVAAVVAAVGFSVTLDTWMHKLRASLRQNAADNATAAAAMSPTHKRRKRKKKQQQESSGSEDEGVFGLLATPAARDRVTSIAVIAGISMMLVLYVIHCQWVTSNAYSSPSIVLAASQPDGSRVIFDDFREAYWWLRQNTPENAKVMSWWDYGYQISAMANRSILVDNNTWNNTHIAQVGLAMSSPESRSIEVMRRLDVDYVLVIFGGMTGYASDDINKMLWMIRISSGVFPEYVEADFMTAKGEFRVDAEGSPMLLNSLMYSLCYYRFGDVYTDSNHNTGYDRVRNAEIGRKDIQLEHLTEAYTSEHWIVRIYKVNKPENRIG